MLYTTNIIKYPFTSMLSPFPTTFTMNYAQNQDYKWIYSNSLNCDNEGNKLLDYDVRKQKVLFSGLIDNPDKRLLKLKFTVGIRLSNGFQFDVSTTSVSFSNRHIIIDKKLKIIDCSMKQFRFQPYLDRIYLNMIAVDNSKRDNSDIKLNFESLGVDLVNIK